MSLFNNQSQSQSQTQGGGLFGAPQQNTSISGANNNNKSGGLFGNSSNPTNISFGANNTTGGNSLFGANTSSNQLTFGPNNSGNNQNNQQGSLFSFNNKGNQSNNLFGSGNQSANLFGQNNTQNANNQQNQNTSSIFGNLSGINATNNQNNNPQQNNFFNQNRQNYIDINNPKNRHDLEEYKQILENVSNCSDPAHQENMFKDYLYMPIPKGIQPSDVNNYRPYTIVEGQQKIVNDYNIWEKASKNNVDPNKYFPIQISSVDALLNRYKNLEKGILQSIAKTVETQKSLEKINKKVDDEMNSKISEIEEIKNLFLKLKNCEDTEKLYKIFEEWDNSYNNLISQVQKTSGKQSNKIQIEKEIEKYQEILNNKRKEITIEEQKYYKKYIDSLTDLLNNSLNDVENSFKVIQGNFKNFEDQLKKNLKMENKKEYFHFLDYVRFEENKPPSNELKLIEQLINYSIIKKI